MQKSEKLKKVEKNLGILFGMSPLNIEKANNFVEQQKRFAVHTFPCTSYYVISVQSDEEFINHLNEIAQEVWDKNWPEVRKDREYEAFWVEENGDVTPFRCCSLRWFDNAYKGE